VVVDLPTLTEKDEDDLVNWGVKNSVDFIAASFVRKGSDVRAIRSLLAKAALSAAAPAVNSTTTSGEWGASPPTGIRIISKVENQEGLTNFADILAESDGIMVARGDLGMEIPLEKMFWVQKSIIRQCNLAGKVRAGSLFLLPCVCSPFPLFATARHHRHPDAGQHDHQPAAHPGGGHGRGQRSAGR